MGEVLLLLLIKSTMQAPLRRKHHTIAKEAPVNYKGRGRVTPSEKNDGEIRQRS